MNNLRKTIAVSNHVPTGANTKETLDLLIHAILQTPVLMTRDQISEFPDSLEGLVHSVIAVLHPQSAVASYEVGEVFPGFNCSKNEPFVFSQVPTPISLTDAVTALQSRQSFGYHHPVHTVNIYLSSPKSSEEFAAMLDTLRNVHVSVGFPEDYRDQFYKQVDEFNRVKHFGNEVPQRDEQRQRYLETAGGECPEWYSVAEWVVTNQNRLAVLLPREDYEDLRFNRNLPETPVDEVDIVACGLSVGGQMLHSIIHNGMSYLNGHFVGLDPKDMEVSTTNRAETYFDDAWAVKKTEARSRWIHSMNPFLSTTFDTRGFNFHSAIDHILIPMKRNPNKLKFVLNEMDSPKHRILLSTLLYVATHVMEALYQVRPALYECAVADSIGPPLMSNRGGSPMKRLIVPGDQLDIVSELAVSMSRGWKNVSEGKLSRDALILGLGGLDRLHDSLRESMEQKGRTVSGLSQPHYIVTHACSDMVKLLRFCTFMHREGRPLRSGFSWGNIYSLESVFCADKPWDPSTDFAVLDGKLV